MNKSQKCGVAVKVKQLFHLFNCYLLNYQQLSFIRGQASGLLGAIQFFYLLSLCKNYSESSKNYSKFSTAFFISKGSLPLECGF